MLKLHANNHHDPLSLSEDNKENSVDKTGVTENERDSHVTHHIFLLLDDNCIAHVSVQLDFQYHMWLLF